MNRVGVSLFVVMVVGCALPLQAREGFGMSKRAAKLDRRVPPEILLVADTVDVRLDERSSRAPSADSLHDLIETKLTSYESRLAIEEERPPIVVTVDLQDAVFDESWEQKRETEYRQTGTKIETDSNGKQKSVPVYGSVLVDVNYKRIYGRVAADIRVTDEGSGETLYTGSSTSSFSESYKLGAGAPMRSELERRLVDETASKIAAALVGAIDSINVLLPRGSFDKFVPIAERGDWEAYLAGVESVRPLKRATDEAYRQYALGVANEGLAYAADTEAAALELLRAAANHYEQAMQMHPKEKLFVEGYTSFWTGTEAVSPQQRVRTAMEDYEQLAAYRAELEAGRTPRTVTAARVEASPSSSSAEGEQLTNASIVALAAAGLADENIILAIDSASSIEFDLSTDGLVALAKAGVSPAVVAHMQKSGSR